MDIIDREQAIKKLLRIKQNNIKKQQILAADEDGIIEWLNALPSAEKTGRWLKAQYPFEKCSVCGAYFDTSSNQANYCCVCGARMEEG